MNNLHGYGGSSMSCVEMASPNHELGPCKIKIPGLDSDTANKENIQPINGNGGKKELNPEEDGGLNETVVMNIK